MCKTSIFKIFFLCLYNFTLPKVPIGSGTGYRSGENFPDPAPDPTVPKMSGFGSATLHIPVPTLFTVPCILKGLHRKISYLVPINSAVYVCGILTIKAERSNITTF